eukprot:gene11857-biopygen12179
MAGMRLVEVIPMRDENGGVTQLYESADGVLHDLTGPVLVVYAPSSRQQVSRNRYPRVLPPVMMQQGKAAKLRDARRRLDLAQQRQREQFDRHHTNREYTVGDLVWVEARRLIEKLMDRQLCRKLAKRWHGSLAVVERFYSDLQAALPEADRGAPVAYRLSLPPHWQVHDVFAQHRLKHFVQGAEAFASRRRVPIPDPVMVDGQAEARVEKILAYRVRKVRGKAVQEWKVRWTGYSAAHDQWRTREKMDRGGENQQLKEFEARILSQQAETMNTAKYQRSKRKDHTSANLLALQDVTLTQLLEHPCDGPEQESPEACYLPWEHLDQMEDGSMAIVTELMDRQEWRPVRILVLFSGTGSVEKGFTQCFPKATVVTLDQDPRWQPTHLSAIEDWDPTQYPPGFFDDIWASPPCTQYSQARTTGVEGLHEYGVIIGDGLL